MSTEHGGTILVPREQGHTRIYVQVTGERAAKIAAARRRTRGKDSRNGEKDWRNRDKISSVGETQVHEHGITPNEVMDQLSKILSPWNVEFAGPMSWFAVWRGSYSVLLILLGIPDSD